MPNGYKDKIWFDGGTPENQLPQSKSTEKLPAETGEDQKPKKVTVPGLEGEYTPDEIRGWQEDSKSKHEWRSKYNREGRDLNEIKRHLDADKADVARQLQEIKESVNKEKIPQLPDWRNEEDPEKRERLRELASMREKQETDNRIRKLENDLIAAKEKEKSKEIYNTLNDMYEDAVDEFGFEDKSSNELLRSLSRKRLTDLGIQNWTPDEVTKTVKQCRAELVERDKTAAERYVKQKKDKAKHKLPPTGEQPAPEAVGKFKAGMTALERKELIANDPNLQP